ncbi:MAG TPA: M23 family metallopeptidase [Anaerolineae bacterium]|nr:M23 family metallopeptidase [Anaerolineae bacterium]
MNLRSHPLFARARNTYRERSTSSEREPGSLAYRIGSAVAAVNEMALNNLGGRLGRYAVHATILSLSIVVFAFSAAPPVEPFSATLSATITDLPAPPFELFVTRGFFTSNGNQIARLADSHTSIPYRIRRDIIVYHVQSGDTVQGIAAAFGLKPETLMWANPEIEDLPDLLRIGQEVVILPIDGVYHEVKAGDTLASIVAKYSVDIEAITGAANEWNGLQPPDFTISAGMKLIVAGGAKPYVPKVVTAYNGPIPSGARGTGRFQWPVIGSITQDYWYGHRALDIAAPTGAGVYVADGGFVTFVGWTDIGYGNLIRIDHGNGFATWYAHLNGFNVVLGQAVRRGDLIGYVGSTGRSSGPHLHFEIRTSDGLLNPRLYLP